MFVYEGTIHDPRVGLFHSPASLTLCTAARALVVVGGGAAVVVVGAGVVVVVVGSGVVVVVGSGAVVKGSAVVPAGDLASF